MIGTNLDEDFHDANDEENCEEWEDSFPEAGVDGREDGSSKSQFQQADPQTESATEGHYQRVQSGMETQVGWMASINPPISHPSIIIRFTVGL